MWGRIQKIDGGSLVGVLLLGVYLALVPSISLIPSLEPYNEKRALQIGLLLAGGSILLILGVTRRRWLAVFRGLPTLAQWGFGTVLGLGILSSVLAPAPFYAFLELGHFVLLFALAGIVALAIRRRSEWAEWFFLGAVGLSALLYAAYFAVSYGIAAALPALDIGRETISGFANTRFFNQYQTWTLPLLVGCVVALPRDWRGAKGGAFFLSALWWSLVLASNVRGTVVAISVVAVGVWLLFRSHAYRWLAVQSAAVIVGAGLYYLLFYLGGSVTPQVAERLGRIGQGGRPEHWIESLRMAWQHPWLGVGPMHYAWPPNHFTYGAHPHSAFFQWLAEWGIPSTLIMSGLTVWGGWAWMQKEKDEARSATTEDNGVRVGLVAALLAGAAHALVSGLIVMPVSQVLLVVVGGWAWGRYSSSSGESKPPPSNWSHVTFCAVIIGAMAIVGASTKDLTTVESRRAAFLEAVDRNTLSPRYWTQGYLNVRDSTVVRRADPNR